MLLVTTSWFSISAAELVACISEERPVCRQFHKTDAKEQRALCARYPGRPVNKCPKRARFACEVVSANADATVTPGSIFTEYTYRAVLKNQAHAECTRLNGRFVILPKDL